MYLGPTLSVQHPTPLTCQQHQQIINKSQLFKLEAEGSGSDKTNRVPPRLTWLSRRCMSFSHTVDGRTDSGEPASSQQ
jgi:hypothetical protein